MKTLFTLLFLIWTTLEVYTQETKTILCSDFSAIDISEVQNQPNYSGLATRCDQEGILLELYTYKDGLLNGERLKYSGGINTEEPGVTNWGQVLIKRENYLNGKKDGEFREYWENGKLKSLAYYENGHLVGEYVEYWEDGTLAEKGQYVNGKLDGLCYSYFKSGNIRSQTSYKNGKQHGERLNYNEDGKLIQKRTYENGKKITETNY